MTGTVKLRIATPKWDYTLELERNITVLKDEGATGKSCLCNLIALWFNNRLGSRPNYVKVSCNQNAIPVTMTESLWNTNFVETQKQPLILFIDEQETFIHDKYFLRYLNSTQDYVVIISRDYNKLRGLTFSVNSIKSLVGGKHKYLVPWRPVSNKSIQLVSQGNLWGLGVCQGKYQPTKLVTEDSNSGYQFFSAIAREDCIPGGGFSSSGKPNTSCKEKIVTQVEILCKSNEDSVLVIADGAAYGGEIDSLCLLSRIYPNVRYYLYESFEWLLLHTPVFYKQKGIKSAVEYPQVASESFLSWEKYFTNLLIGSSRGIKKYAYSSSKSKLPEGYLEPATMRVLLQYIPEVSFERWIPEQSYTEIFNT